LIFCSRVFSRGARSTSKRFSFVSADCARDANFELRAALRFISFIDS
jgi:hypothetical protein